MSFEKGSIVSLNKKNAGEDENPSKIIAGVALEDGPPGTIRTEFGDDLEVTGDDYLVMETGGRIKHADLLANGELVEALWRLGLQHRDCMGKLYANKSELAGAYGAVTLKHKDALLGAFTGGFDDGAGDMFLELVRGGEKELVARHLSQVELNSDNQFVCRHCESPISDSIYLSAGATLAKAEMKETVDMVSGWFDLG